MFKNIGKALAVMLSGAGGGRPLETREAVERQRKSKSAGLYAELFGSRNRHKHKPYTGGGSAKRTTAAAQKRAAKKRANKRKNPKGSK